MLVVAVILVLIAYFKVVVVKKFVVGFRDRVDGSSRGELSFVLVFVFRCFFDVFN